jgi:hypothetical protein
LKLRGEAQELLMPFRVFSGPPGTKDISADQRNQMLFKECASLDEALSWARHMDRSGRLPLLIEGDDGTRFDKRAIANALRAGQREDVRS